MLHCQLEKTGLAHHFAGNSPVSVHTLSNSGDDGDSQICDWITSGGLQTSESRVCAPEFVASPFAFFLSIALSDVIMLPMLGGQAQSSLAPPELASSVQFVLRTALPVRAPSLTS